MTEETAQIISSIVIGIGTGLASSLSFLWFMTKVRPSLEISDRVAHNKIEIDGTKHTCFRFKVINKTWKSRIYDVEAQLVLITYINSDTGQDIFMTPIPLIKDKTWSLNKISKSDTHAEYAHQFITLENLHDIWTDKHNIELRVKAKHSFSGFSRTTNKRYYNPTSSLKNGSFKFGNTTDIG
ncbi:MAG: hypothetical protein RIF36_20420 [Imperialibacter sp.]|uniref:hypothetical protein n=1 Tax=Imperialibacter sp. TaxID=2038411 RepID=UPI0032EB07E0